MVVAERHTPPPPRRCPRCGAGMKKLRQPDQTYCTRCNWWLIYDYILQRWVDKY